MKLNELVTPVGARIYHTLTGNHDEDVFLSSDDMSSSHWELLMACHHQGQCSDDCDEAEKYFSIDDINAAAQWLIDCGIERDRFFNDDDECDDEAVTLYYLWMLAGDIQEMQSESEGA